MKKVIVTFCLVVALIINLPSDSVLAATLSGVVTSECVLGFDFGEDITGSSPDWTYNTNTRLRSLFNTSSQVIDDFGFFNKLADLNVDFSDSYYLIISTLKVNSYGNISGGVVVYVLPKSSVSSDFVGYLYLNPNNSFNNINITGTSSSIDTNSLYQVSINQYYYYVGFNDWGSSSITLSNKQGSRYFDGYTISGGISCESILYSNMPVIDGYLVSLQHSYYNSSNVAITPSYSAYQLYTDLGYGDSGDLADLVVFDFANLPYYNGSEIIDPPSGGGEESNEHHMYFNSCDIGFAEPYKVNNFSSFGGAYFYCKYNIDSWIINHINDYDIYFSSTAFVGSRQYNGSKRLSVDPDGCITIPFSDIFTTDNGVISNGFISATNNTLVDNGFYKTYLYSVAGDQLQGFVDKLNNVSSNSVSSGWDQLVDAYFGNWLLAYNSTGLTQVINNSTISILSGTINHYSNYKIQVQVYLIDKDDNRSGSVGRLFDLYTGSNTSTDNSGLTNDNPFIDDNIDDTTFLPDVPDNTDVVGYGGGSNNSSVNVNVPSNYTLRVYNGLEEFIAWYNSDPQTAEVSTGFWNSFGIFRNNPALDLYEAYFGFLPSSFKAIIFGCATIGIVGGVFSCLRRKIT